MDQELILYDGANKLVLPTEMLSCFDKDKNKWVDPAVDKAIANLKAPKLMVDIKATFSGVLTNNKVYPGKAVQDATKTWVHPFNTPILPSHPVKNMLGG